MAENELIKIEGIVDTVLFCNEQNGYIVLELDTGGTPVTVVGELGDIDEGEQLAVTGKYVSHPKYGDQFRAEVCERKMPATANAIRKYLSSGAIKGIGPTMAARLVDEFGESTLDVMEKNPRELTKVKGMSAEKAEAVSREFQRIFGVRTLMIFLMGYGISPSVAVCAWKKWGQFSVEMIKSDPYVLCSVDLDFARAEQLAEKLNIPKDSHGRVSAGIIYILQRNSQSGGHTCLPLDKLTQTAMNLLQLGEEVIADNISAACDEERITVYNKKGRDFVFLTEYFRAEQYAAVRLSVMNDCFKDTGTDYRKLIENEEKTKGICYAEKQRDAIALALSKGFLVLTGGPGTGKTTALKAIISLYVRRGFKVCITAPTGRAAKRISDLTGYSAKTIHRLLEVAFQSEGEIKFRHNEQNPLDCDVIIIDEMSMVDTLLFEALLRAMKLSCRLIMVGDSDQLPSVGAGNVLGDMIGSGRLSVVALTEIFRQAQHSRIVTNAHRIVNGIQPDLSGRPDENGQSDFFFMPRYSAEETSATVADLCGGRLPAAYDWCRSADDIQVLCPSRKGPVGTAEMNNVLQARLNPPSKEKSEIKGAFCTFRCADKVMQVKNNYDITWVRGSETGAGIYNGDIGTIVHIKKPENTLVIDFDGRIAEYPADMLDQLELAYAVTVHKSQGSEFNAVIIPLVGGFDRLCYRNLLYTAVTRAKKLLIIVGSKDVVEKMVSSSRKNLRYTCLKHFIDIECGGAKEDKVDEQ